MRTRHVLAAAVGAGALTLAGAGPASAHAVFQTQTVPADTHTTLTLNVPVERKAAENSRIDIFLPDAFDAHSCTADEGWSCTVDNDKDPEHPDLPQVTFTRVGCPRESSFKCAMEPAKPDTATPVAFAATPAGFSRIMHGDDGDDHDEGGGPGVAFHFLVHTPAKAGDYPVKVVQHYNTGEIVSWSGDEGSKTPAPVLRVG